MKIKAYCYRLKKEQIGDAIDQAKEKGIVLDSLWSNRCKLWIILVGLARALADTSLQSSNLLHTPSK